MSFDYSTLITDRARSDSDTLKTLLRKPMAEWTAEERTAFNAAVLKGSYDYTDLNRVGDCLEDLVARLGRVGCNVPGYERLKIERAVTPSSRLPEGYAEVQYIQSTGAQWIDTEVKPDQTYALKIKFQTEQSSSGGIAVSDANWQSNGFGIWCNAAAFGNGTMQTTEWHGTTPIEIELSQQGLFVNGNLTWTPDAATFTVPANMTLFALNRNGSIAEKLTGKIYFAQLLKAGKLVRDFIPCVDPTGTVGLYDLVGGKFYGNSGTGVFTAGPVVTWDEPTQTLDPYTWYESDVPVPSQMARYRANVAAVRAVLRLPEGTPETPETMRRLTTAEANSIEAILLALNFILNQIPAAVRHCGVTVCGSKGVRA